MTKRERFGDLLRHARLAAGKSQGEIAKRLGTSVTYVSDVEGGRRAPLVREKLLDVAEYLNAHAPSLMAAAGDYGGEVSLPMTKDEDRNLVAAMLSVEWTDLSTDALDRIARILQEEWR